MLNKHLKISRKYRYTSFKSQVESRVWRRMSPAARNTHKARQIGFKKLKRKKKIIPILNKYPRNYSTTFRKTALNSAAYSGAVTNINTQILKRKLMLTTRRNRKINSMRAVYAWNQTLQARSFKISQTQGNKTLGPYSPRRLLGVLSAQRSVHKFYYVESTFTAPTRRNSSKFVYWNFYLPTYYLLSTDASGLFTEYTNVIYVVSASGTIQINKKMYGSLLILNKQLDFFVKDSVEVYESPRYDNISAPRELKSALKENSVINLYGSFLKQPVASMPHITKNIWAAKKVNDATHKRGYLKHVVRMRYRWFFKPKLSQFKLFKKFFKRALKRYRKISKNRLFINKFRSHFPKLTGFTEKILLRRWLPFRRNYNQYWAVSNSALRFSQSLLLAPTNLLVFLRLSPSFSASKYIIKSGAVSINGLAISTFNQLKPGDILQLNFTIWKSIRSFFDYQKWNNDAKFLQYVPFLQVDWASLMFFMTRWPRKHELVAPSFLSERWIRYYIRQFPSKIRNFKKVDGNWRVYKRIVAKR